MQVPVNLHRVGACVRRLRKALRLGKRSFNVCFVGDREMARMNEAFRGKFFTTDVLSFPWQGDREGSAGGGEFANFLGDVVISAETARRSARAAGQSVQRELAWLILHGLLHLLGYDHETDSGEMTALEHSLRRRLGL